MASRPLASARYCVRPSRWLLRYCFHPVAEIRRIGPSASVAATVGGLNWRSSAENSRRRVSPFDANPAGNPAKRGRVRQIRTSMSHRSVRREAACRTHAIRAEMRPSVRVFRLPVVWLVRGLDCGFPRAPVLSASPRDPELNVRPSPRRSGEIVRFRNGRFGHFSNTSSARVLKQHQHRGIDSTWNRLMRQTVHFRIRLQRGSSPPGKNRRRLAMCPFDIERQRLDRRRSDGHRQPIHGLPYLANSRRNHCSVSAAFAFGKSLSNAAD